MLTSSLFVLGVGAVTAFLFGITIGSFLNVCIYRLPAGMSVSAPPSHCFKCNTRLRPVDLVPLLSYLALRGKCRYCGTPFSWRYFIIEFITGLLFVGGWVSVATMAGGADNAMSPLGWLALGAMWVFISAMLVTFMIDLDTTLVFEPVTWVAAGAGIVFEVAIKLLMHAPIGVQFGSRFIHYLPMAIPGMIIGFLVFRLMDWMSQLIFRKPGMGDGDAFIGMGIGAMLGPSIAMLSFGVSILLGAFIGIALMIAGVLKPSAAPGAEEDAAAAKAAAAPQAEGGATATDTVDEELPQGRYMPFGPFLTGSAVFVALAPTWFADKAGALWHWWLYNNPLIK